MATRCNTNVISAERISDVDTLTNGVGEENTDLTMAASALRSEAELGPSCISDRRSINRLGMAYRYWLLSQAVKDDNLIYKLTTGVGKPALESAYRFSFESLDFGVEARRKLVDRSGRR